MLWIACLCAIAQAALFPVTSTSSADLAAAIAASNALPGFDEIALAPGLNIAVLEPLPDITEAVYLHGAATLAGAGETAFSGLRILAGSSRVEGLTIQNFGGSGLEILGGADHVLTNLTLTSNGLDGLTIMTVNTTVTACAASNNTRYGVYATSTDLTVTGCWVAGNGGTGIYALGARAVVQKSIVGLDQIAGTTAFPNAYHGIQIFGDDALVSNNSVGGNKRNGIQIDGARAVIKDNVVGLNRAGTAAVPNLSSGIAVYGNDVFLQNNVASGNGNAGILIFGANAVAKNNFCGLDAGGIYRTPNTLRGIEVQGNNPTLEGNFISGNLQNGLQHYGVGGRITRNVFGLNIVGLPAPNTGPAGCVASSIGALYSDNIVSANLLGGIYVTGRNNVFLNNWIGIDPTGLEPRGSGEFGMYLLASNNVVDGNIVSGGGNRGIYVSSTAANTVVKNNWIGLDKTGRKAVPNGFDGMWIEGPNSVAMNNTIAANNGIGILVSVHCTGCVLDGNIVGMDATRTQAMPNLGNGITISAANVTARNNVVAHNKGSGIAVLLLAAVISTSPVYLVQNSETDNTDGAILLPNTWPVPRPEIFQAVGSLLRVYVKPPVGGGFAATHRATIEVFGDALGVVAAQGWQFLCSINVTVDSNLNDGATFDFVNISWPDHVGQVVATVTFLGVGTSTQSEPAVVFRTTDTCNVCSCVGTIVDCRARGLTFLPSNLPNTTTVLDVSDNPIRSLSVQLKADLRDGPSTDWGFLLQLPDLVELNLTNVKLNFMAYNATELPSHSLKRLYLGGNTLTELPADFADWAPNLETLDVSGNPLQQTPLPVDYFSRLPELTELSIASCGLTTLPDGIFDAQAQLLTLDLSGNHLTHISAGVLSVQLSQLSFLSVTQAIATATANVSLLSELQGTYWQSDSCSAGYFGVGNKVCLRCPPGTAKAAGAGGRPTCLKCAAGFYDNDQHGQTPCVACPAGTYASPGSVTCAACADGFYDDDRNASTPCAVQTASASSMHTITPVVASLCLALLLLMVIVGVLLRRRWQLRQPFSFAQTAAELAEQHEELFSVPITPREIPRKCIKTLNSVGKGAFGTVFKALLQDRSRGVPEHMVAVKTLKLGVSDDDLKDFLREAALMAPFDHPNVVSLVGVCTVGEPRMIVLQYCEHGSLLSFLKAQSEIQMLTMKSKIRMMGDIAAGMAYLHTRKVVHRDLAARNVLVSADFRCKIADFGLSRMADNDEQIYMSGEGAVVPLRWTAPEALKQRQFSESSDVWAFGIVCGEIFNDGEMPYKTMTNNAVLAHVHAGGGLPRPALCSVVFFEKVLRPCFEPSPQDRPMFTTLAKQLQQIIVLSRELTGARDSEDLDALRDFEPRHRADMEHTLAAVNFALALGALDQCDYVGFDLPSTALASGPQAVVAPRSTSQLAVAHSPPKHLAENRLTQYLIPDDEQECLAPPGCGEPALANCSETATAADAPRNMGLAINHGGTYAVFQQPLCVDRRPGGEAHLQFSVVESEI